MDCSQSRNLRLALTTRRFMSRWPKCDRAVRLCLPASVLPSLDSCISVSVGSPASCLRVQERFQVVPVTARTLHLTRWACPNGGTQASLVNQEIWW